MVFQKFLRVLYAFLMKNASYIKPCSYSLPTIGRVEERDMIPVKKKLYLKQAIKTAMYKPIFFLFLFLLLAITSVDAQKNKKSKKLNDQETKAVLDQLVLDKNYFLRSSGLEACDCIDSVDKAESNYEKTLEGVAACISKQVSAYEVGVQMAGILKNPGNENQILVSQEGSDRFKQTYYEIERRLKDSCKEMNEAIGRHDQGGEHAISKRLRKRSTATRKS
jgi:hypothetical protein